VTLDNYQEVYRQTKILKKKVEYLEDEVYELGLKIRKLEEFKKDDII
jgi:hypothetical protein